MYLTAASILAKLTLRPEQRWRKIPAAAAAQIFLLSIFCSWLCFRPSPMKKKIRPSVRVRRLIGIGRSGGCGGWGTSTYDVCIFTQPLLLSFLTASAFGVPFPLCRHRIYMSPWVGGGGEDIFVCEKWRVSIYSSASIHVALLWHGIAIGIQGSRKRKRKRNRKGPWGEMFPLGPSILCKFTESGFVIHPQGTACKYGNEYQINLWVSDYATRSVGRGKAEMKSERGRFSE